MNKFHRLYFAAKEPNKFCEVYGARNHISIWGRRYILNPKAHKQMLYDINKGDVSMALYICKNWLNCVPKISALHYM